MEVSKLHQQGLLEEHILEMAVEMADVVEREINVLAQYLAVAVELVVMLVTEVMEVMRAVITALTGLVAVAGVVMAGNVVVRQ